MDVILRLRDKLVEAENQRWATVKLWGEFDCLLLSEGQFAWQTWHRQKLPAAAIAGARCLTLFALPDPPNADPAVRRELDKQSTRGW